MSSVRKRQSSPHESDTPSKRPRGPVSPPSTPPSIESKITNGTGIHRLGADPNSPPYGWPQPANGALEQRDLQQGREKYVSISDARQNGTAPREGTGRQGFYGKDVDLHAIDPALDALQTPNRSRGLCNGNGGAGTQETGRVHERTNGSAGTDRDERGPDVPAMEAAAMGISCGEPHDTQASCLDGPASRTLDGVRTPAPGRRHTAQSGVNSIKPDQVKLPEAKTSRTETNSPPKIAVHTPEGDIVSPSKIKQGGPTRATVSDDSTLNDRLLKPPKMKLKIRSRKTQREAPPQEIASEKDIYQAESDVADVDILLQELKNGQLLLQILQLRYNIPVENLHAMIQQMNQTGEVIKDWLIAWIDNVQVAEGEDRMPQQAESTTVVESEDETQEEAAAGRYTRIEYLQEWDRPWPPKLHYERGIRLCYQCRDELRHSAKLNDPEDPNIEMMKVFGIFPPFLEVEGSRSVQRKCELCVRLELCKLIASEHAFTRTDWEGQ